MPAPDQPEEAVQGLVVPTDDSVQVDDVARLTADAVLANRLYILPHRASRDSIRRRFERIDRTYDEQTAEGWSHGQPYFRRNRPARDRPSGCMELRWENGLGHEATQRHGRHVAVQRDAQPAHAP